MSTRTNIVTLTFTDEELKIINDFHRSYVLTTEDIGLRRAVLIKILLLKTLQEPKAIEKLAKIRRVR